MAMPEGAPEPIHCSFCGKPNTEVERLVAGPGVRICDECVALAQGLIEEHRDRPKEVHLPLWEFMSDEEILQHIPRVAAVADQVEADLRSWVQELRRRDITWARIGQALGITRQSAWERFSGEA